MLTEAARSRDEEKEVMKHAQEKRQRGGTGTATVRHAATNADLGSLRSHGMGCFL